MGDIDIGRPVSGDICDLIVADHRRMEGLLRQLRDSSSDRDGVRHALAALLVAHAEAEEHHVYTKLKRRDDISAHDAHHGKEEHAEGHAALLAVLELKGTTTTAFDDAVKELSTTVSHHLAEEELSILNPAREEQGEGLRAELGTTWLTARNSLIDDNCGAITKVRAIVAEARKAGLLEEWDEKQKSGGESED